MFASCGVKHAKRSKVWQDQTPQLESLKQSLLRAVAMEDQDWHATSMLVFPSMAMQTAAHCNHGSS